MGQSHKEPPHPFLEEHPVVLRLARLTFPHLSHTYWLLPGPLCDSPAILSSGSLLGSPRNEEGAAPVGGSSPGPHRVWGAWSQVLCDPELPEQPKLQRPGRCFRSGAGLSPPLPHPLIPFISIDATHSFLNLTWGDVSEFQVPHYSQERTV